MAVSFSAMSSEGVLDAVGVGGSDALVDGQGLPQVSGAFAGVAVVEVGAADPFQGACLFQAHAEFAGDGQCLGVVVAGLLAGRGPGRELAEAVQRFGLVLPIAGVAEYLEGLLVAGGRGGVVAGLLLYQAELVECAALALPVAAVAALAEHLLLAGGGGPVVPGQPLQLPEVGEYPGLPKPVASVPVQRHVLLEGGGGGLVVTGQHLRDSQSAQGLVLAVPVADGAEQLQCLPVAGRGGRVVPGPVVDVAQADKGVGLA